MEGSRYFRILRIYIKKMVLRKRKSGRIAADSGKRKSDGTDAGQAVLDKIEKKKEKKNPPLLYNLAELQNDCSRMFKISPDETLRVVQELYEKKLVTSPRTDARVLSTAVAKEIGRNIHGLLRYAPTQGFVQEILEKQSYRELRKPVTSMINRSQNHYAIIPTGQGLGNLNRIPAVSQKVYQVIVRRFLSIFYPPAVYQKVNLVTAVEQEKLFSRLRRFFGGGYLAVASVLQKRKNLHLERTRRKPMISSATPLFWNIFRN